MLRYEHTPRKGGKALFKFILPVQADAQSAVVAKQRDLARRPVHGLSAPADCPPNGPDIPTPSSVTELHSTLIEYRLHIKRKSKVSK